MRVGIYFIDGRGIFLPPAQADAAPHPVCSCDVPLLAANLLSRALQVNMTDSRKASNLISAAERLPGFAWSNPKDEQERFALEIKRTENNRRFARLDTGSPDDDSAESFQRREDERSGQRFEDDWNKFNRSHGL